MNLPNKLTLGRIIATPVFMATVLIDFPYHYFVSFLIFTLASLTDMVDGKLARKYNLITNFGKFLDPLADKMLTTAAYLGFISIYGASPNYCWQVTVISFIVMFREFSVSGIRLLAMTSGNKVIAANIFGKLKTLVQMVGIVFALLAYSALDLFDIGGTAWQDIFDIIILSVFWLTALLSVVSGVIYLVDNKKYISSSK